MHTLTNIIRSILIVSTISALSCARISSEKEIDWTIERTESIKYAERDGKKIRIVYSDFNSGLRTSIDTSMAVEIYKDTLLLERIEYNLRKGDTIKWRHQINEFNVDGMVMKETDSVHGALRKQVLNFYENGRLQRKESLAIVPDYNSVAQIIGGDTMRFTSISVYNEIGKCTKVITVSKDELSSVFSGTDKYDTSTTHKQFNEQFWETASFTVTHGDTTGVSRIQYDEHGWEVAIVEVSVQTGMTTFKFEYDEHGNRISELVTFDEMMELTLTEYDNLNRPVIRKVLTKSTY